jgi:signal transduction histidine kinase
VTRGPVHGRAATARLLLGLVITLVAVVLYSWYVTTQISRLRVLQGDLIDRNRQNSLQLLRIQNDLNSIGLAMRDMLDGDQPYPLTAWSAQFQRIRTDLEDALGREAELAADSQSADQRQFLTSSFTQFWDALDRTFALAASGREEEARTQIRLSLQARQASLSTSVSRLLVQNHEREEQATGRIQTIYGDVQRQVYWLLTATLLAIAATSAYLIRSNRQLFAELAAAAEQRRELAQKLIATRESTLRHISRELHDELGQTLTAIGSMLRRAGRKEPDGSPLHAELREIGEIAQSTLDQVRQLSQTLHPSILEEAGLESALDWYLSSVQRQLGIAVCYERSGPAVAVDSNVGIQVYRVLQEALTNVARHSGAERVWVRLRLSDTQLQLDVEDEGKGIESQASRHGLGIVAMRERAALVGGTIEFLRPRAHGTLVRLTAPLTPQNSSDSDDHRPPR